MSSFVQKFKVILWKSYILRRRHWLLSLFEVLAPLFLFYCLTKYAPTEGQTEDGYVTYPVKDLNQMISDFKHMHYRRNKVAYAPDTKFTKEFMFQVEKRLNKTAIQDNFEIKNFKSEDKLNKWLKLDDEKDKLHDKIGIVFGSVGRNNVNKMQYKIRVPKDESAQIDELFGYGWQSDQYFGNMFLILQMVMDLSFIERIMGKEVNIGLQRFPDQGYGVSSIANVFFALVTTFSFVFIMPAILKKVVEEKLTGIKELQKLMGLHGWMLWTGWMIHSLMIYGVSAVIITAMFRYHWMDRPSLLYHVDSWTIILCLFMLFVVTMVLYCFAISAFFTSPNIAMICGILLWIVPPFAFLDMLVLNSPHSKYSQLATCLSPPMCLSLAFSIFMNFQHKGEVWSWSMFFEKGTTGGMSMAHVLFMFYFDWFLFAFITWYVDSIKPGPFGRAKPIYFIFNIWKKDEAVKGSGNNDQVNFESPPQDSKVGIRIQDLRKVFGSKVAVDCVNMDIYEGEITALLGHNGAGKTTTMSILTGLYSPSKGAVVVNGKNIFGDMDQFRHSLGLCPQHNLLFSYLTVIEHLIFFGMLKGLQKDLAEAVGLKLLVSFQMVSKSNEFVSKLSGGMKRKLCLSIALMGDPKVIMLDEPTSGMDPESRREVWEILLSYRGARTILITTHFMEEADVLGDRIAIMDHGRVSCYGTSLFLKKLYGTGYHIAISKEVTQSEIPISTVIESYLNEPKLKTNLPTQLTYNVSSHDAPKFSKLFEILEARKSELGITGLSIACTTMEDVFLRVADGVLPLDDKAIPAEVLLNPVSAAPVDTKVRVEGWQLTVQQFRALFIKKSLVMYRTWLGTLAFAIIPLLTIMLLLKGGFSGDKSQTDESIEMNLQLYGDTVVPYTANSQEYATDFQNIVTDSDSMTDHFTKNINEGLIAKLNEDQSYYYKAVVGAEFNQSSVTGLYNSFAVHSPPISLNLITNSILKAFGSSVVVMNQPFSGNSDSEEDHCDNSQHANNPIYSLAAMKVTPWILLAISLMFFMCRFISLPLIERANNAKQLQLMTKLSPFVYWLSHFIWDFVLYTSVLVTVIVAVWLLDKDKDFTSSGNMNLLFLLLLLYGISGIPFAYLFSFLAKSSAKATSLFLIFNLLTGIVAALIMLLWGLSLNTTDDSSSKYDVINVLLCFNPLYAETSALLRLLTVMIFNSNCYKCLTVCTPYKPFEGLPSMPTFSILEYVVFLMTEWILFWLTIFLIEFGLLKSLWAKINSFWVGPMFKYTIIEDDDVLEEKQKAKTYFHNSLNQQQQNEPVLKVCGLGKKYTRKSVAVHDASFLVEKGQCFGLLGVNGAGKTTTFKMLTGEEIPSVGTASILNYDLVHNKSKYLGEIGYCPQFDGLIEVLTGEEMLRMYALLRGTTRYKVESEVDNWVQFIGIQEFAKAKCGTFSGGNKRKLSTAMALIGDPPVVFLDEPTAGVDPVSRRKLWDVLAQCQKSGQAIVLTSHSMEECEALCSRLTILVGGHMKCIGSTQYLKQRFGQGYTIMIKLLSTCPDYGSAINSFKNTVNQTFSNCFIKDEHKGLLHYHIADKNVLLSVLFSKLEMLRQTHPIVEDYTVGDTTLEQVFMSFAKQIQPLIVIEPVDV